MAETTGPHVAKEIVAESMESYPVSTSDKQPQSSSAVSSMNFVSKHLAAHPPLPPITRHNLLQEIDWTSLLALTIIPALGTYGAFTTEFNYKTLLFSIFYYFVTGLGITAGYHRLWAHRSYNASRPLQWLLAFMGAGGVQGSIKWWARGHRAHHRYTDTELDPYSAHRGFWWSHIGWIVLKPRRKHGPVDISDLVKNDIVMWQHKYFIPLLLFVSFVIPTVIPGLCWGDYRGGYFYAGLLRLTFVHHSTFCVNSLAHWLGDSPFDDKHTPKDHVFTALCTIGEGFHNFHHQFPSDYRNAIKWYHYDPTRNFIYVLSLLGLATNLKRFSSNEIAKGQFTMELKRLHAKETKLKWPVPAAELPIVGWQEFLQQSKTRNLIAIHGFIHDVTAFVDEHPGGARLIQANVGKDATSAFFGGQYDHSNAAHNLLAMMRVAILEGGGEVEVLKRSSDVSSSTHLRVPVASSSSSSLSSMASSYVASDSESVSTVASSKDAVDPSKQMELRPPASRNLVNSLTTYVSAEAPPLEGLPPPGQENAMVAESWSLNIPPSERLRIVYSVSIPRPV